MKKEKEYSEKIQQLLKSVYDNCVIEDRAVRERQLRTARRLKLFWEGFQNVWYSEVAHDWRIWDEMQDENTDQAYYDKPINLFRAYLESIIAALSILVPPVTCYPDDADNPLDITTAKAGDKIAQLVQRHNDVSLLWLHALFVFCTEGMVGCYAYPYEDKEYGTYEENEYEDVNEQHQITKCPNCGTVLDDQTIAQGDDIKATQQDKFMPGKNDVKLDVALNEGKELCPACMVLMDPEITQETFTTTRLVGVNKCPKSRICMESYGVMNIKIPVWARRQKDCPYLIYSYETHYANAIQEWENLKDKKLENRIAAGNNPGAYNMYDQWARLSPQYQGEYPINVTTVNKAWLRPAIFNVLNDEDDRKLLKKEFPDGVKVIFVNEHYATACPESLDDCWTLTYNPLSDYLHHDPLGLLLTSIQELVNDIVSLTVQTMEHGVGLTFAEQSALNFKAFEQVEVTPGGVFPATAKQGKSLGDSFHELRTATLSGEVLPFFQNVQQLGQNVSGALPSLWGGQIAGAGGDTASGYSMSRAQAQQRIGNLWKIFLYWWKNIHGKVIPMYIDIAKQQGGEKDVKKVDGDFVSVLISKAELEGKIGRVELEASENLPQTWSQRKDVVMQLATAANPLLLQILGDPENLPLIRESLGLTDFLVPGEDDREKQYNEIRLLLQSQPIPTGDEMNPFQSSIDIDPINDNNQIQFNICKKWAISEVGQQAKVDNPDGYHNVLLHGKAHYMALQPPPEAPILGHVIPPKPKLVQPIPPQQPNPNGGMAPPPKPNNAPITGDGHVNTIQ